MDFEGAAEARSGVCPTEDSPAVLGDAGSTTESASGHVACGTSNDPSSHVSDSQYHHYDVQASLTRTYDLLLLSLFLQISLALLCRSSEVSLLEDVPLKRLVEEYLPRACVELENLRASSPSPLHFAYPRRVIPCPET